MHLGIRRILGLVCLTRGAQSVAFVDTPMLAFSRQHSVPARAPGTLVLFDNVGDPSATRAARYVLDEANPGCVFRAQRIHSLYAPGVGSAW